MSIHHHLTKNLNFFDNDLEAYGICDPLMIDKINNKFKDIYLIIEKYICEGIALFFDLQSFIISANTTIFSALERNESKVAHQRSEITKIDPSCKFNYIVNIYEKNNNSKVTKSPLKELIEDYKVIISNKIKKDVIRISY